MEGLIAKYGLRAVSIAVLAALLLAVVGWGQISSYWYKWRAGKAQQTSQAAKQEAVTQTQRANTAEASNDIHTRAIDAAGQVKVEVVMPAERSAQRIENRHETPAARPDPVDDDVIAELDAADRAYRQTAEKLRKR